MKDVAALLPRVVGPLDDRCVGSPFHPEAAYVTTPLIGIGTAEDDGPETLVRTLAFDRAESEWANLTQTNLVQVSSFNGPQGLLLGYDLLKQPLRPHPLLDRDGVFDAAPLFEATRALYGGVRDRRFPIAAGQHLLCACKTLYRTGPCRLYGTLAVAIAEDRVRDADLFLEDHGALIGEEGGREAEREERRLLLSLVDAVRRIGENIGSRYSQVFVGLRSRTVQDGEVGCVLTAAPYIHLARRAVPDHCPEALAALTLAEWERAVLIPPLRP